MKRKFTHKLIRSTAIEICGAAYEEFASDDTFYKQWPSQKEFIRRNWKDFIKVAKATMAQMLQGNYPQGMKDEIFDALIKDNELPGGDMAIAGAVR